MSLRHRLAAADPRRVEELEAIRGDHPGSPELLGELAVLVGDPEERMRLGASWLLRAFLEDGVPFRGEDVRVLARALPAATDGFTRLHLCQAMRHIPVGAEELPGVLDFLRECWRSSNTFVRAWAPDALAQLARRHPELEGEAARMLEAALSDPRASVRARARRTLAEG